MQASTRPPGTRAGKAEGMRIKMQQLPKGLEGCQFVIVADGEGAQACIVAGSNVHQSVHDFMCCCRKPWRQCECGDSMISDIELLSDPDSWIFDEDRRPFSCSWPHETGKITIYRIDNSAAHPESEGA